MKVRFIKHSTDTELSLNIKNPKNIPLPPPVSAHAFNEQGGFDPDAVVSRYSDGSIASRFKDPVWDFSALANATSACHTLRFNFDEKLANEVKTILKLLMLATTSHQISLHRYYYYFCLLKRLAEFCKTEETALKTLFNTKGGIQIIKLIKEMPFYALNIMQITQCLQFMREAEDFEHGYSPLGKGVYAGLRKIAQDYQADSKQNPVIPSRILKTIYHDTISEYEALLPVLDELLAMQAEIDLHPMVGRPLISQKNKCRKYCSTSFDQLIVTYPTNYDLAKKYPLARDFLNHKFNISMLKSQGNGFDFNVEYKKDSALKAINYIQRVCMDIIIMFTGMRPTEAILLPYYGSKETLVDGVKYWLIYGFAVKKRTDVPPFELWVTNEYGYRAFQTAKHIADLYYVRNQRQPIKAIPNNGMTPELSPLYLRNNGKIDKRSKTVKKTPVFTNSYLISKADFNELKMIDPHRKWEGEPKFAIGEPFPVELQFFRRSIAFFASASGVRLVDMKNQLHHLFDSQTFYYSNGSGRANPFLKNKDSFASYFNQTKHEAEAFGFINEVINFDGKLFGASATYAERNQEFYNTIHEEDRPETIKRFKRGELSYTETHLGGCKTLTPCKNKALGSVTACLECKDADIKPEKLANAIKDQANLIGSLNPDRLEFRTEIQELIIMLNFGIKNTSNTMERFDRRKREYKLFSTWHKEFKQMRKRYLKKIDDNGRAV
ncbi:MAG: hypothetical protein HN790_05070 [Methylococcales bacterium]|jgi:hypothetical protein|nr:hypothetical protein [Methylococcales bacterium]